MKAAVFAYFIQYCRHIVRSQAHSESGFSDTCLIPALPASIETQADLACVGSTLCFQPEQARQNKKASSAKCSLKLIILRMKRDSNSRRILPSHAFEACSLDRSDIHPFCANCKMQKETQLFNCKPTLEYTQICVENFANNQSSSSRVRRARIALALTSS